MLQSSVKPKGPRYVARGVTMLEVMVVVAIIGIVAAIATPNFGPMLRSQKLQAKAEEVAGFFDRARRDAFASGRCVKVRIDGDKLVAGRKSDAEAANCYQEEDDAAITGDFDTMLPLPVDKDALTLTLQGRIADEAVTIGNYMVFRPNGRVRGDGDLQLNGDSARVLVEDSVLDRGYEVRVTPIGRICKVAYTGNIGNYPAATLECP